MGRTSEFLKELITYEFLISAIETGKPSKFLTDMAKIIHKSNFFRERIGDKEILESLKEFRKSAAKNLLEEVENPTVEL